MDSEMNLSPRNSKSTREWILSLAESLMPKSMFSPSPRTSIDEVNPPQFFQDEPDWWYNFNLNLYGPQSLPMKEPLYLRKEKSAECIEPYMEPLKEMKPCTEKHPLTKRKPKLEDSELLLPRDEAKSSLFHPKKRKDILNECEAKMWTCECIEDTEQDVLRFAKKTPPPFEPCICIKPLTPLTSGSDFGFPPICSPVVDFTTARYIVEELPDYSVTSYGRGLVPSTEPIEEFDAPYMIVQSFLLTGQDGFQVEVSQLGARVVSIRAPDACGRVEDVVLGFDRPKSYLNNNDLHWGGIVGRLGDRVRGPLPQLFVPGKGHVLLEENDDRDYNMGGISSFDKEIWEAHVQPRGILFTLLSHDGVDGFPGHVVVSVSYSVEPVNRLVVQMEAMASAPTPFALMLPLAFNLAGHGTGEDALSDHVLTVAADKYFATDNKEEKKTFTGLKKLIGGTPYDLRIPRKLKKVLKYMPKNCYDLIVCPSEYTPDNGPHRVAKLVHPQSRRMMEVWSDLPAMLVSTCLGLSFKERRLPDVHTIADMRDVVEQLIHDVPLNTWTMFDWLRGIDIVAGDDGYFPKSPPLESIEPRRSGPRLPDAGKPRPRWRDRSQLFGVGDNRPSHPGLYALPHPLRGPTKLPFGPSTMSLLRAGGLDGQQENPVGRVDRTPRDSFTKEEEKEADEKDREPEERKSSIPKRSTLKSRRRSSIYNLKPSTVGTVPPRSESIRPSIMRQGSVEVPGMGLVSRRTTFGSISTLDMPVNPTGSVYPLKRGTHTLPPRRNLVTKPLPFTHRPSIWGKTHPSTWGTERLRAGADFLDFLGIFSKEDDEKPQSVSEQPEPRDSEDQNIEPDRQETKQIPAEREGDQPPDAQDGDQWPVAHDAEHWPAERDTEQPPDAQDRGQRPAKRDTEQPPEAQDDQWPVAHDAEHLPAERDTEQPPDAQYGGQRPAERYPDQHPGSRRGRYPPSHEWPAPPNVPQWPQSTDAPQYQEPSPQFDDQRPPTYYDDTDQISPSNDDDQWPPYSWPGGNQGSHHHHHDPYRIEPPFHGYKIPGLAYGGPTGHGSVDLPEHLFQPQDATQALRRSGLGSIAEGFGMPGVRRSMIAYGRPSGFGSIITGLWRGRSETPTMDVDLDKLKPQKPLSPTGSLKLPDLSGQDQPMTDLMKKLLAKRMPPNKGYEVRMPMRPKKEEVEGVVGSVMDEIMDRIETPPRICRGFNNNNYHNNGAIILQPQLDPLFKDKRNLDDLTLHPGQRYRHTIVYAFSVQEKKKPHKKHAPMGVSEAEQNKEELMVDICSVENTEKSESSDSFVKLHDSCSEKSSKSSQPSI